MNMTPQFTTKFSGKLLVLLVATCILSACGPKQHPIKEFKAYSGDMANSEDIVSIKMFFKDETKDYVNDYVDWVEVDKTHIDHNNYGEIRINPGSWHITWGRVFDVSSMIKASGKEKRNWSTNITLEAGHTYTIHARRTVGHGYKIYSWITDDTAGDVVWGQKYIPGPYDYLLN